MTAPLGMNVEWPQREWAPAVHGRTLTINLAPDRPSQPRRAGDLAWAKCKPNWRLPDPMRPDITRNCLFDESGATTSISTSVLLNRDCSAERLRWAARSL